MGTASEQTYLIALGSNRRHPRIGAPRAVLAAALEAMAAAGMDVLAASPAIDSRPLGPSWRTFANAAALVTSEAGPPEMLARLQAVERGFGRRRGGPRWGARVLDLDIILWSGGIWTSGARPGEAALAIPHPAFRERDFVLRPAKAVAPGWRDPATGLSIAQLARRRTRPKALDRRERRH